MKAVEGSPVTAAMYKPEQISWDGASPREAKTANTSPLKKSLTVEPGEKVPKSRNRLGAMESVDEIAMRETIGTSMAGGNNTEEKI